ncbi:helix-turn-helix domain-containing protein [Roseofilum sp. Guam]|uniref:helix-turn-helix domain-containing protein n=1 Tax=Roseofilum sp. Guam TaxID=2821502 RepID=UPI001B1ECFAF|nr:helix-turn-helix domain-containing protein [Roseofilum sp. Guam]MBP0028675.1 helix-turn-helix domain-containing protein [Roseofilum sp. Guam]
MKTKNYHVNNIEEVSVDKKRELINSISISESSVEKRKKIKEAAEMLGKSRRTIQRWVYEGLPEDRERKSLQGTFRAVGAYWEDRIELIYTVCKYIQVKEIIAILERESKDIDIPVPNARTVYRFVGSLANDEVDGDA